MISVSPLPDNIKNDLHTKINHDSSAEATAGTITSNNVPTLSDSVSLSVRILTALFLLIGLPTLLTTLLNLVPARLQSMTNSRRSRRRIAIQKMRIFATPVDDLIGNRIIGFSPKLGGRRMIATSHIVFANLPLQRTSSQEVLRRPHKTFTLRPSA